MKKMQRCIVGLALTLIFCLSTICALNAQTETRGIGECEGNQGTYVIYFDNRKVYAPSSEVTTIGGLSFLIKGAKTSIGANGELSIGGSGSISTKKVEISGIFINKGTRVNVHPRRGGFYGDNVSVLGKNVPNKKDASILSNKKEEAILIGYSNMYWYAPRRCLVQ